MPHPASLRDETLAILGRLGVPSDALVSEGGLPARSPITGEVLAGVRAMSAAEATAAIGRAHEAFRAWRMVPGPRRGELWIWGRVIGFCGGRGWRALADGDGRRGTRDGANAVDVDAPSLLHLGERLALLPFCSASRSPSASRLPRRRSLYLVNTRPRQRSEARSLFDRRPTANGSLSAHRDSATANPRTFCRASHRSCARVPARVGLSSVPLG